MQKAVGHYHPQTYTSVPFGVTYEKIGTIQRRLAWPLHKDDTLSRSGRPTGLNIYFLLFQCQEYCTASYLRAPAKQITKPPVHAQEAGTSKIQKETLSNQGTGFIG